MTGIYSKAGHYGLLKKLRNLYCLHNGMTHYVRPPAMKILFLINVLFGGHMRILDVVEVTRPIASPIRNAYIDFSKMTTSLVAVVTDVEVDGRRVVGYGFNSNGRYGQGGLIRERFRDRILNAAPDSLLNDKGDNLDPHCLWDVMMSNEKPGGYGERSVAVGTLDMAIWDATAKIAGKPLFRLSGRNERR
jgi:L-alanine-DL-glutamate epimerase-like enolase superfamily enzyme